MLFALFCIANYILVGVIVTVLSLVYVFKFNTFDEDDYGPATIVIALWPLLLIGLAVFYAARYAGSYLSNVINYLIAARDKNKTEYFEIEE